MQKSYHIKNTICNITQGVHTFIPKRESIYLEILPNLSSLKTFRKESMLQII